jgi:uncharacterized protein (DUF1697 family)
MKYIALLRGINVGGNKKVPMADLKKTFEILGFTNVKTLLNSGNVIFVSKETNVNSLKQQIEQRLEKTFGFVIPVIIRTHKEIQDLVVSDPFMSISATPEARLYITFLSEKSKNNLKLPYESENKDARILQVSNLEICSVVVLSPAKGTLDLMSFIEKEFGKNVTTRNWNTVVKLANL